MRKHALGFIIAVAILFAAIAPSGASSSSSYSTRARPDCTSRHYRTIARAAYKPWWQPVTAAERARLYAIRKCALNVKTKRQDDRIRENQAAGKAGAVANYRAVTPYRGLGTRWAIPSYIVACESGGSWFAHNPSGAGGAYQLMPEWGAIYPATTMPEKMQNHRIAAALWAGGAGASNWVCA